MKSRNNDRIFSSNQFLDLMAYAELLQRQNDKELRRREETSKLEELGLTLPKDISLSEINKIAKTAKIPQECIEKTVSLFYPSSEEQIEDFKKVNATLSESEIIIAYEGYVLNALQKNFQSYEFSNEIFNRKEYEQLVINISRVIKKTRNIIGIKRVEKEKWMEIKWRLFEDFKTPKIEIYNKLFLRGAGETMKKLNNYLGVVPKVVCNYHVDLSSIL